ncbi:uncharacterized protein SPPG_04693 [Spizellomyces punctatus DAOM BR117]|uniref:Xylulose kinase n=1 Tax=Spizellomyces punctatus (strain DAOM BR117) TaxID=645134 RepID=A0A0L0HHS1_SPIPD|nr:uncharacterized protein SPPG_04693 [Spizellomyces punctatus DAOM BR117]KND00369.1 hypothetical protein SPPG_04693 [Spizellomyces punctatus DAOM BR117]|eukprot:XP_016608408.1 hypothetical protein SPPG_04693 [Spizellomyces punctatus DAOM BR117]
MADRQLFHQHDTTNTSPLYLGLDLSTQQLKLVVIDDDLRVLHEEAVNFDRDLPHYGTEGGVKLNGYQATAPTIMWVEALDLLLGKMKDSGFPSHRVAGISGCAQQHGTVYWKQGAEHVLAHLNPESLLHEQLRGIFSVESSPIWQDSSTSAECEELEVAMGGAQKLADITGSSAYERFSGSQLRKIAKARPEAFAQTERISLVSSFAASMLIGKYAPIDTADGSGMNLLDIHQKDWDDRLLNLCGADLRRKLGAVVKTDAVIGFIASYFVERYGFRKDCMVVAWSGDNPDSLASLNLRVGDSVVSMGTSDTLLLTLEKATPSTEGHVLCHPTRHDAYMAMIVYKNGSLTRERIRDTYAWSSWEKFNSLVENADVGCGDRFGFFFYVPEITPKAQGVFRFEHGQQVEEFSRPEINARAVLESQFLSMRLHARRVGYHDSASKRIIVTGGASQNDAIVRVLADVFGAVVMRSSLGGGSATLGAAYRARYGVKHASGWFGTFEQSLNAPGAPQLVTVAEGSLESYEKYSILLEEYERLERDVCRAGQF